MTTGKEAQVALRSAEAAVAAARQEQAAARTALTDAMRLLADAGQRGIPAQDAEKAEAAREKFRELEYVAFQAKGRVARTGVHLHRAEVALEEARARADRLTVHAAVLEKLSKVQAAIASKDQAILGLGREMQERVSEEVGELRKLIADADALWTTLPPDVRTLDVNPPHQSAQYFGQASPSDPGLLYRLGVLAAHYSAVTAPTAAPQPGPVPLRAAEGGP